MSDKLGKVLILSGGEYQWDFVSEYIKENQFNTVACADAGLEAAKRLGLSVDYVMGDFDSTSRATLDYFEAQKERTGKDIVKMSFPPEKDATDTHIVLEWVLEQGCDSIEILGACGKRQDHFMGNIHILLKAMEKEIPACLIDAYNKIYFVSGSHTFYQGEIFGKYISLLPFCGKATGVTIKGLKYEVEDFTFQVGDSIGISNEMGNGKESARVEIQDGVLLCVESRDGIS